MQQSGFFWHWLYDSEVLLEWCHSYDEYAKYIRTEELSDKQEVHLRLFQPVKGELPKEVVEALKARLDAQKLHDEARKSYDEAQKSRNEARKAYIEAWTGHAEAWQVYKDAFRNHKDKIEALHAQECLDCPWDGKTIFPAA